ncbi:MAG: NADP-dependent malic enzyme [Lentisphaeria bacterium]|nr:NADP-dependent malic enzyme [Lentisphaeria bacterium]
MAELKLDLSNLNEVFPSDFTADQIAEGQTILLKELSARLHTFYGGKMMTIPKAALLGFNWFNVWYSPGVSKVSTSIREDVNASFTMTNRSNLVGVVSDSTRVLGDGDCTPPGGLGVMEGKAFLMKMLGGVDAVALCIDSKNDKGEQDAQKIIDFVKMGQHSFGAINLEDISQPVCFEVLDKLRDECEIPVWHDDAQGTGCVTLAGIFNALKLAEKKIEDVKIVLLGAGAANTTIANLIIKSGGDPKNISLFDRHGGICTSRSDYNVDKRFYKKWDLAKITNPQQFAKPEDALVGADVLIALSQPGPDVVKPAWVSSMADKSIVFVCANPVPEIYPHTAKEAGAFIVATGRGDFPNQVNNSLCFPGILKGALTVSASKITDEMAIVAAKSIANFAEDRGIDPNNIVPTMEELDLFPRVAADVAMQAEKDGVARAPKSWQTVYDITQKDITDTKTLFDFMQNSGLIEQPPQAMINDAVEVTINTLLNK